LANLFLFSAAYSQELLKLTGDWTMFEMSYITSVDIQTMDEAQMKEEGYLTDLCFMEDGQFQQTSNMSGSGTLDTYEGTWEVNEKDLLIHLRIGEREVDVDYTCEMNGEVLILTRTSPDGSLKIVSSYKEK
jgi:hypothetical protein